VIAVLNAARDRVIKTALNLFGSGMESGRR